MNSCIGIAWCNEDVRDTETGKWLGGFEFLPGLPILVDQRSDLWLVQQEQDSVSMGHKVAGRITSNDLVRLILWRKGKNGHPDDRMLELMVNKNDFLSAPHLVWLKERG